MTNEIENKLSGEENNEIPENNDSLLPKQQVKKGKDDVNGILDENTGIKLGKLVYENIDLSDFPNRKLGKSLTEEANHYTMWAEKDGQYFRILNYNAYEANVEEYAKSTLNYEKYQVIKDFISDETYTCEKIDSIENDLTMEQILSIGGEYLAYKEMTASKITVIGFMLGKEDIKKIGAEKLALMSIEELNKIV